MLVYCYSIGISVNYYFECIVTTYKYVVPVRFELTSYLSQRYVLSVERWNHRRKIQDSNLWGCYTHLFSKEIR